MSCYDNVKADRMNVAGELYRIVNSVVKDYTTIVVNNGSSVIVKNDKNDTNIYVRLEVVKDGTIRCNFSSVEIGEKRQGIFSGIVQGVIDSDIIKSAVITSVVTNEMDCFCKKHKLKRDMNTYCMVKDYIIK